MYIYNHLIIIVSLDVFRFAVIKQIVHIGESYISKDYRVLFWMSF